MALKNFVDNSLPVIDAAWLNEIDRIKETTVPATSLREFTTAAQWADIQAETLLVDCSSAFAQAHTDLGNGDSLELPPKLIRVNSPIEFTKKISIVGPAGAKAYATICALGFAVNSPIIDYQGTTDARIQDIELKRLRLYSDNAQARGLGLTWVNKSNFEDLYFYNLYRGYTGDNAWSNSWKNCSAYAITEETMVLGNECNNNHFDRCEFRGKTGMLVNRKLAGLQFTACDFEGLTSATGAGLKLAPPTGETVRGVSLTGCYWENVKGYCLETAGIDADSVLGLVINGGYMFPGSAALFGGAAGSAEYAIVLANTRGFEVSGVAFEDIRTAAFFRSGTELDGSVRNCTGTSVPALTNSSNQFSGSVEAQNNFKGRRVGWSASIPVSGTYEVGDYVYARTPVIDANNLVLLGWSRLTTGSNHVLGTDWARDYGSHVTPAA